MPFSLPPRRRTRRPVTVTGPTPQPVTGPTPQPITGPTPQPPTPRTAPPPRHTTLPSGLTAAPSPMSPADPLPQSLAGATSPTRTAVLPPAPAGLAHHPDSPGDPVADRTKPRPAHQPPSPKRARIPLTPADRQVLSLYLLTRAAVWTIAYCTRWLFPADSETRHPTGPLSPFQHWDWWHYLHIAQDGYFPHGADPSPGTDSPGTDSPGTDRDNREAFFPGFPLALRAVHTLVPDWAAAGALISLVAGAVAVLALARIARRYLPDPDTGRRAVLFFLLSPCAVFLAAGYTEALFLAFALPAWLAAQRRDWPRAALLACLATTVRPSGLFLAAALIAHYLTTIRAHRPHRPHRPRHHWRTLPWLALPALPLFLYSWYLQTHTGDWMAWKHAEERGWYRTFHAPWDAWRTTWDAAFGHIQTTGYAIEFQAELLAMLLGLALTALLVRHRRWPEALYIALTLWALGTSYWYMSIPRATLLWWPLWCLLAARSLRTPWITTAYLTVVAPLMTVCAITFMTGRWAG